MNKQNDGRQIRPENERSTLSSKEDENLIQNWSLTFTEYMQDANQISERDENVDFTPRQYGYPDGRFQASRGHDSQQREVPGDQRPTDDNSQGVSPSKLVHVHVDTGGPETNTNGTSEGSDRQTEERSEQNRRYSHTDTRRPSGEEVTQWYKEEVREQIEQRKQQSSSNQSNQFSKHSVLPSINSKTDTTPKAPDKHVSTDHADKLNSNALTDNGEKRLVAENTKEVGVRNGDVDTEEKISKDKPVVSGYLGGRVQPIYMRFPGQRTGQMVL